MDSIAADDVERFAGEGEGFEGVDWHDDVIGAVLPGRGEEPIGPERSRARDKRLERAVDRETVDDPRPPGEDGPRVLRDVLPVHHLPSAGVPVETRRPPRRQKAGLCGGVIPDPAADLPPGSRLDLLIGPGDEPRPAR